MSLLGEELAKLSFQGHKKRKLCEVREKEAFGPAIRAKWDVALDKYRSEAVRCGAQFFEFTVDFSSNSQWWPESTEEVFQELPDKAKELTLDPKVLFTIGQRSNSSAFTIKVNLEGRCEELIAEAEAEFEKTGKKYW